MRRGFPLFCFWFIASTGALACPTFNDNLHNLTGIGFKTVNPESNSLARVQPESLKLIKEMRTALLNEAAFRRQIMVSKGRIPVISDRISYLSEFEDHLKAKTVELVKWVGATQPELAQDVELRLKKVLSSTENLKNTIQIDPEHRVPVRWDGFHNSAVGALSEVQAAFTLGGVTRMSVSAGKIKSLLPRIHESIDRFKKNLLIHPENYKNWFAEYPRLLPKPRYSPEQMVPETKLAEFFSSQHHVEEYVVQANQHLEAHDMDVVSEGKNDTWHWTEVKYHSSGFTKKDLLPRGGRGESDYVKQLKRDREWIRFLGLEDKITLQFYPSHGMDAEARQWLEKQLKIRIIQ